MGLRWVRCHTPFVAATGPPTVGAVAPARVAQAPPPLHHPRPVPAQLTPRGRHPAAVDSRSSPPPPPSFSCPVHDPVEFVPGSPSPPSGPRPRSLAGSSWSGIPASYQLPALLSSGACRKATDNSRNKDLIESSTEKHEIVGAATALLRMHLKSEAVD